MPTQGRRSAAESLPATCPLVPCNGRRVALAQALPDGRQAGRRAGVEAQKPNAA